MERLFFASLEKRFDNIREPRRSLAMTIGFALKIEFIYQRFSAMARFFPGHICSLFGGGSNGKPENRLIVPDTGNAVEGKKRE
jgi:hypothetical protein